LRNNSPETCRCTQGIADEGQMWLRVGLEDRFLASVLEIWVRGATNKKSLAKKPISGRTTKETEQMTPAGSGIGINSYIPKSHHTFFLLQ
jgi:hypothetical protein